MRPQPVRAMTKERRSLLDPFGFWQGLGSRLEQGLQRLADGGVRSDGFASGMNKAMQTSLLAERQLRDLQRRLLALLNLPSRSELLNLGEKLQAIEDRMMALSLQLSRLDGDTAAARHAPPSPPRTRKPPPAAAVDAPTKARPARKTVRR